MNKLLKIFSMTMQTCRKYTELNNYELAVFSLTMPTRIKDPLYFNK